MSNRKPNKKEFTKDITYLVNFKNYEKPKQEVYNDKKHKQQQNIPFSKERFLQANYRFIVSPKGDYSNNVVDPDLLVEWENVEQLCLQTFEEHHCPICLDNCIAAKVSRCGHVFCYPCIIRHLSYGSRFTGNCPVCFAFMALKDLKSAVIQTVHHHSENDAITFQLLKRAKYSTMALPKSQWRASTETCPLDSDQNSRFCRFAITADSSEIVERERAELMQALWEAQSSQDDSIPFIETALAELEDRAITSRKKGPLLASSELPKKESAVTLPTKSVTSNSAWDEPITQDSISSIKSTTVKHEEDVPVVAIENLSLSTETSVENSDDFYYVYQSSDAQQLFLHPLNVRVLLNQYGSYDAFPETLSGKILEIEELGQSEQLRKRYRFLGHLPVACQFKFVEIDMRPLVTPEAIEPFYEEITKRVRHRKNIKRKEEQEKQRIEQEALMKHAQIDMGEFPAPVNIVYEESEPAVVQSTSWPPTNEKPSFLDAAKANKVHITSSMPVKQNAKGKQIVLMSTSGGNRRKR